MSRWAVRGTGVRELVHVGYELAHGIELGEQALAGSGGQLVQWRGQAGAGNARGEHQGAQGLVVVDEREQRGFEGVVFPLDRADAGVEIRGSQGRGRGQRGR